MLPAGQTASNKIAAILVSIAVYLCQLWGVMNGSSKTKPTPAKLIVVKRSRFNRVKDSSEIRKALKLKEASGYKIHKMLSVPAASVAR
jgi:hypothetical protein